jgi:hypothetical protein
VAKSIVSLPRLTKTDDLVQWSGDLVNTLQKIFVGSGAGFIDGNSILDGTLGTDKLLSTAGGLWNSASVVYQPGYQVVQLPNSWVNSGGIVYIGNNQLQSPAFAGWGIATFYGHITEANAVGVIIAIEINEGSGFYPRAQWRGGVPLDANIAILFPMAASTLLRVTINNTDTIAHTIGVTPAPIFTLGMIGQQAEPAG